MLISPTDRDLHQLGKVSSLPEKWGCDVLIRTSDKWIGVQRKELKDFITSVPTNGCMWQTRREVSGD